MRNRCLRHSGSTLVATVRDHLADVLRAADRREAAC
jgi:hypothetical protein